MADARVSETEGATSPPIPVTVIGGYLGAGKTTLLNHVLRHNQGKRIAVLVNDFGAINIDAELITSHDGDTINLANGCVCCSLAAGFHTVMTSLLERDPPPERVIVEASGVALPHKIGQYGHMHGFRLDGVVVLVDVETIRARSRDKYVGKTVLRQLHGADLLVLTKTDLVSDEQIAAVRAWLRALAPEARMVAAVNGTLPMAVLFGFGDPAVQAPRPEVAAVEPGHVLDYDTASIRLDHPVTNEAFCAAIAALPESILRGKGIVWLAEDPSRQSIFQLVGRRWSVKPGEPWDNREPETKLVFIGLPGSIAKDALGQALAAEAIEA